MLSVGFHTLHNRSCRRLAPPACGYWERLMDIVRQSDNLESTRRGLPCVAAISFLSRVRQRVVELKPTPSHVRYAVAQKPVDPPPPEERNDGLIWDSLQPFSSPEGRQVSRNVVS
jgi:hypothetical protein